MPEPLYGLARVAFCTVLQFHCLREQSPALGVTHDILSPIQEVWTRSTFLADTQRIVRNARLAKAAGGGYLLRETSFWGSTLSDTTAYNPTRGGASPPQAVFRRLSGFLAAHPGDLPVALGGLTAMLWLVDALQMDQLAPALLGAATGARRGPVEVGAAVASASRALAQLLESPALAERAGSSAAASSAPVVAAAACWLIRDALSGEPPFTFIDPKSHAWLLRHGSSSGVQNFRALPWELDPAWIAEAAAAVLAAPGTTAEAAGAACGALTSLYRADWCGASPRRRPANSKQRIICGAACLSAPPPAATISSSGAGRILENISSVLKPPAAPF